MTLQLALTPDLESRLKKAASQKGKPADQYAVQLLDEYLPGTEKNLSAVQMLLAWAKEDESLTDAESAENEQILRAIDQNRLSDRKLFGHLIEEAQS